VKKIVLLALLGMLAGSIWAQDNPTPKSPTARKDKKAAKRERVNALLKQEEEGEIIFHKQGLFGVKLTTDGYGLSYERARFKSDRVANIFQVELNERKHKKEKKESLQQGFNFSSLIYGKMNNFYQLKLGMGQQRIIGGKGNKNGVAVMAIYAGGVSAGLLKPYYVDVKGGFRTTWDVINDSVYHGSAAASENYQPLGSSGFTVGWGELKFRPGLHAKTAMRFDFGRFNETVTALEVGLNAEYYFGKIPQMDLVKEKHFFFNAYLSLLLGRRK
jgi:hypothetical protein